MSEELAKSHPWWAKDETPIPRPIHWILLSPLVPLKDVSHEQWKNIGWLFDIGDYTTQLYRDFNKPL